MILAVKCRPFPNNHKILLSVVLLTMVQILFAQQAISCNVRLYFAGNRPISYRFFDFYVLKNRLPLPKSESAPLVTSFFNSQVQAHNVDVCSTSLRPGSMRRISNP
jgi:hypothetical protein